MKLVHQSFDLLLFPARDSQSEGAFNSCVMIDIVVAVQVVSVFSHSLKSQSIWKTSAKAFVEKSQLQS